MQGVETASMANDVCGVPLPWTMTNPWLFFDGKLFHLKLKMSTCVQSLRELCDDHIEIVMKIERFRKAILEDVEHFLLPTHNDSFFRGGGVGVGPAAVVGAAANFLNSSAAAYGGGGGGTKHTVHPMANIPMTTNGYYGGGGGGGSIGRNGLSASAAAAVAAAAAAAAAAQSMPANYYGGGGGHQHHHNNNNNNNNNVRGGSNRGRRGGGAGNINMHPQLVRQIGHRQNVCQLKVGGVVVGSWAGGIPPKHIGGGGGIAGNAAAHHPLRFSRTAALVNQRRRGGSTTVGSHLMNSSSIRRQLLAGAAGGGNGGVGAASNRAIARTAYGVAKINKNRARKGRADKKPVVAAAVAAGGTETKKEKGSADGEVKEGEQLVATEKKENVDVEAPKKITADNDVV